MVWKVRGISGRALRNLLEGQGCSRRVWWKGEESEKDEVSGREEDHLTYSKSSGWTLPLQSFHVSLPTQGEGWFSMMTNCHSPHLPFFGLCLIPTNLNFKHNYLTCLMALGDEGAGVGQWKSTLVVLWEQCRLYQRPTSPPVLSLVGITDSTKESPRMNTPLFIFFYMFWGV